MSEIAVQRYVDGQRVEVREAVGIFDAIAPRNQGEFIQCQKCGLLIEGGPGAREKIEQHTKEHGI